jgi:hypothetical protein
MLHKTGRRCCWRVLDLETTLILALPADAKIKRFERV